MITGWKGIQRCLTWASDLTIKIDSKEAETETEMEAASGAAMGGTEGIYRDGDIARDLKRIDKVLVNPSSQKSTESVNL